MGAAFFYIAIFWVSAASADEIRLDTSPAMKYIPVMDQGKSGLCAAYATAQMFDAYRFSHGDQKRNHLTSPIHLASRSTAIEVEKGVHASKRGVEYRFPWTMLEHAQAIGSCSHLQVLRAYNQSKPENIFSTLRTLLHSDEVKKNPGVIAKVFQYLKRANAPETPEERFICEYHSSFKTNDYNLYPTLDAVRIALMQSEPLLAVDALISDVCKEAHRPLPEMPFEIVEAKSRATAEEQKILQAIDTSITAKNPQPAGVVFCLSALKKKGFVGIKKDGSLNLNCDYHVALVVGRRENAGKTEYLVRNSMGTGCYLYDRECEGGQVWIPAEELAANTTHAYYLKGE